MPTDRSLPVYEALQTLIPELAESEDEKIINAIIGVLKRSDAIDVNVSHNKMFAYLEKQKEQKPNFDTHWENGSMVCEQKEQKPAEWKPQPESLEALMYAIDGKWDMISPTSYLSRRLEDLYEGLVNTYNVDESLLDELPKVASRTYTAEDIEELKELKKKIDASMEQKLADEAKDFFDSAKSYGDRELPQLAKVKATGKIVNIINGTLSTEENRWIAYSSDKEDGYKIYRPDQLFFLDTESKSEERFEEARKKYQVEWSEEDESELTAVIYCVSRAIKASKDENERNSLLSAKKWLQDKLSFRVQSLRSQPTQLKEAYKDGFQTARHAIALAFMNYLDENRPDGKMCLSNGECEDIDKAFKEGDWAKVMRYYEKYRSSWKPSEEQEEPEYYQHPV